jgi:hypothetical protein
LLLATRGAERSQKLELPKERRSTHRQWNLTVRIDTLSHWQVAERAAKEKASIYETKEEGMEGWTQEQLEEAINKKHGTT